MNRSIVVAMSFAVTLAVGGWSSDSHAATYNPSDLAGTWHFYTFWDGDANDPGWTRSTVTLDSSGSIVAGQDVSSEGPNEAPVGSVLISSNGAVTLSGGWASSITALDLQMDTGKTLISGVFTDVDGFGEFRNLIFGVKQGSGFTTSQIAGTWEIYVYWDTGAFNDPGWTRLSVVLNGGGNITSGSFVDSEGVSSPVTGSATVSAAGQITLQGAWAAGSNTLDMFLDVDGTVMAGVFNDVDGQEYRNIILGVKLGTGYQQSDLTGNWSLYSLFDNMEFNEPSWSESELVFDASGVIQSATLTESDGTTATLSGSASIDGSGIVSLAGSWVADFTNDHFAMDAGKTVVVGIADAGTTVRNILAVVDSLPLNKRAYFANPASNQNQQGFVRVVNTSSATGLVTVSAIDKDGVAAAGGDLTFTLGPNESKQFNSLDYENGNVAKGLTGALGDGTGKWQFSVTSDLELEVMSLIRTPDGFVTSVTDVVPISSSGANEIYFANPASNQNQQGFLRVVNTASTTGLVTVSGIDKSGNPAPGGDLTFTLGPNESKGFNSLDYENGNPAKGLTGALGDGTGKWWLSVTSPLDLEVMSLIRSPDGFLTNLSGVTPKDDQNDHRIFFANPASNLDQQTFIRVVNTSDAVGTVTISGVDDDGFGAPGGDVQFQLGPFESSGMNIQDLEVGNTGKGLLGALGDGSGRWQLTVSSALTLQVMNMIRTADGFVTNVSQAAPKPLHSTSDIFFVNPGSNTSQRSLLRLVNRSGQTGNITISGIDDAGNPAPGGTVTLSLLAFSATQISAADLENGNVPAGLTGALGDGAGKWRLSISSDVNLEVISLLSTPAGFLTNLSRVIR